MSLPSDWLQNLPALLPPPGVQSNFDNPETQSATLIKVNVVFLALMLVMVTIRMYTKGILTRKIWWDDC